MGVPNTVNPLFNGGFPYYQINRSLRFRSSASAYLNRTPASASNQTTWTWSGWVKRGILGTGTPLFSAPNGTSDTTWFDFFIDSSNKVSVSGYSTYWRISTQVLRDPSAWYHLVCAVDTTQATANNRILLYVNGVQITAFDTTNNMAQNANTGINAAAAHYISRTSTSTYADQYLAEVNFIDGQALTPSSFGVYDSNGIWQPIRYAGTYGTNGFYLPFSNTTSTTTLVADASGNGNNWTPNNISLTAGTTYDSMLDSPTNYFDGSYNRGNYPTLNPLIAGNSSYLINGNLSVSGAAAGNFQIPTMQLPTTGKWYCEISTTSYGASTIAGWFGVSSITGSNFSGLLGRTINAGGGFYQNDVYISNQNINVLGSVIGIAVDRGANTVTIYINNVAQSTVPTLATGIDLYFAYGTYTGCAGWINFGQQPFTYTPPTGFQALNTANLPQPLISNGANYMAATTYTGTGSNITITNSQSNGGNNAANRTFYPDFVWTKGRSAATNNIQIDSVRGGANYLISDSTSAEANNAAAAIQSFSSTGYVMGTGGAVNTNGATYVGWQWNAGSGTTSTNTSGSITSTVSVNTTAGFSVATFTTPGGSNPQTIGHGLGVAPSMIIMKSRNNTSGWNTYHSSVGNTGALNLQTTGATSTSIDWWQNTSPTSSVWSIGANLNISGWTWVAYCFAAVRNYSAMGSYTGNGSSDGPFIYTGFRPRFLMVKNITTGGAGYDWGIWDTSRSTYNVALEELRANLSDAERTNAGRPDILSNGFKMRNNDGYVNGSGNTMIYIAFAENPFQIARAR